jgi:hypothetical protein
VTVVLTPPEVRTASRAPLVGRVFQLDRAALQGQDLA